ERVSATNNGDDIDSRAQSAHQFNVNLAKAVTGRGGKIQKRVNAIVTETGITLDPRLLGQNVIVLTFKVAHDFLKAIRIREQEIISRTNSKPGWPPRTGSSRRTSTKVRCQCCHRIPG